MLQGTVHITIGEDSNSVFSDLKITLEKQGYRVQRAGRKFGKAAELSGVDLIILDFNFSGLNGISALKFIQSHCQIPIFTIDKEHNRRRRIKALEAGADDHFFKPLDTNEMVARIGALLRRITHSTNNNDLSGVYASAKPCSNMIYFDKWVINPERYEITSQQGEPCALTTGDFALLMLLLKNARNVLTRDQIMNALHGHEWSPYDRSIDNHVSRLRRKIEVDPNNPQIIKTVRGAGYTLVADVTKIAIPQGPPNLLPESSG